MPSNNDGDLAEAFQEISREFKSLQQSGLGRDSASGDGNGRRQASNLSSLDVDELSSRLEGLRTSLAECLTEIESQRRASLQAAGGAHDFYRALGEAIGCDAADMRRREDELNAMDDPSELTDRAAQHEAENAERSKGLRLKSAASEVAAQFQQLEAALKESAINCAKARERAAMLREELEAAKRREEDRRRQDAEEAERRRQEELRRRQAAEAAAAAAEAERRRREKDEEQDEDDGDGGDGRQRRKSPSRRRVRARAEAEARRKREADAAAAAAAAEEAERRWRPVVFSAMSTESDEDHSLSAAAAAAAAAADFEYACAIRAPDGAVKVDDFRCSLVPLDQADMGSIPPGEELVGCAVRLEPAGLARVPLNGGKESCRHWCFMLPHCAQRQTARETVIYVYQDGRWSECPSTETHIEGLEFQTRWVETRITEACVTAVAVNKLKTDRFHVGKPGIRYCSSVDNRICLTVPEDALKIQLDQSLEVQPIDSTTLASIKAQLPRETQGLLTCSSIIQHTSLSKNTLRPASFNFPLPLNPAGAKKPRPGTASAAAGNRPAGDSNSSAQAAAGRPMTARAKVPASDDDEDELVVILGSEGHRGLQCSGNWSVLDNLDIEEEPGKDTVSFRTTRLYDRRFIAFRVKPSFNTDTASRICEAIERSLEEKLACFVLRQKSENLTEVSLALSASSRLDRTLKLLQESGYDYDNVTGGLGGGGSGGGSAGGISEDIRVRERQQFRLRFRGNIVGEDDDPDGPSEYVLHFNSQMKNRMQLTVTERDRFAQRALDQFRGFLEISTEMAVQKTVKDAKKGSGQQTVTVMEEVVVAKMLICVPKSEEDLRVKSPRSTPFAFKSKDAVTMDYLRDLADLVCDSWELLAEKLDVSKKRCSVIKKTSDSLETQAYDMLITWVKKLPVLKNKVLILCRALNASGNPHLAASLRDAERDRRLRQGGGEIDVNYD